MPTYVIEPPDILLIEGINIIPKSPYYLKTLDVVSLGVRGTLPDAPISGAYPVEPGGVINLGVPYGAVKIAGLTSAQAKMAIEEHLRRYLQNPGVSLALMQMASSQQILGEFLVGPDGNVTLGSYGNVSVVGLTILQAKRAIEAHLSQYLESPVISLSVFAFNSKVYYVIIQGAGLGDGVIAFP